MGLPSAPDGLGPKCKVWTTADAVRARAWLSRSDACGLASDRALHSRNSVRAENCAGQTPDAGGPGTLSTFFTVLPAPDLARLQPSVDAGQFPVVRTLLSPPPAACAGACQRQHEKGSDMRKLTALLGLLLLTAALPARAITLSLVTTTPA